jgi:di/tricarboxylate transporter
VIANNAMAESGLPGHEIKVFLTNLVAHLIVAIAAYFLLGGHKLSGRSDQPVVEPAPMSGAQRFTLAVVAAWVLGVVVFKLNVGLSAFAAVVLLVAARTTEEGVAIKRVPWGVIVMVCGVSVLIALLENTGGLDLFSSLLARLASPGTIYGVMAFVTGTISIYSSTSGVVLPTFLPTVPGVIQNLGGGDPLALSLSINVGSALVDVSPLSTLGALCVAAVPDGLPAKKLFRQLLIWGFAMAVVGAVLSQVLAPAVAGM